MTNSIPEIREADLLFVIGSNTTEAHPIIAMEMKRAVRRGTDGFGAGREHDRMCMAECAWPNAWPKAWPKGTTGGEAGASGVCVEKKQEKKL